MKRITIILLVSFFILMVSCAEKKGHIPEEYMRKVVTHRVVEGETWKSIADDFYSDSKRARELALYNGSKEGEDPMPGSGVKIPFSDDDLGSMRKGIDAAKIYNMGLKLVSDGNYAEAIVKFQKALRLDRSMHDASFNLAVTYQRLGLHKNAVTVLRDLTVHVRGNTEYLFALGNSLFHIGKIEDAEKSFQEVLDSNPTHLKSIYSLAIIYEKRDKKDKAIEMWQRYLKLDPSSDWADKARSHLAAISNPEGGSK
ncbi:tetratricopeptide repeat protein [bacterium]|nr:tetratricopeptide repeat protein [bacterium]